MNSDHLKSYLQYTSLLMGGMSLLLGAVVLYGWYTHNTGLIQVNPAFVPMQYNTALGFLVTAIGMLSMQKSHPVPAVTYLASLFGFIVVLIGFLTLIEYIFGVDLKIDQLFMAHYIDLYTSHPGRMAPNTALCFTLSGVAILTATSFAAKNTFKYQFAVVGSLGMLILGLGIVAFTGYMTGLDTAYGWGNLTKMAIHTAWGFILLGIGFFAYALKKETRLANGKPAWLPFPIGIMSITLTLAFWQAIVAQHNAEIGEIVLSNWILYLGILSSFILFYTSHLSIQKVDKQHDSSLLTGMPAVVLIIGLFLSFSVFTLLHVNFQESIHNKFKLAFQNHVQSIELGIRNYIDVLYSIRTGFDASEFVSRDEFYFFVAPFVDRYPGIKAFEWVPKVSRNERQALEENVQHTLDRPFEFFEQTPARKIITAPEKDWYYPVYYIEPLEENLKWFGLDVGSIAPAHNAKMRAVDINAPVGSKRMKLVQSTGDSFGTVVSLPVYKKNQPTRTVEQRRSALKGFVAFVIKIEPMIEIILDERTHTAGLHLEFYDTDAPGNEQFLYTHYSRADSIEEEQEPVYQLEQSIIFADRKWKVIGKSASLDIYPEWTVSSLILPFLIMLGSFGIAAYLLRSSKRDEEREIIINELESTETALKEIQERFELAIDGSGDALWEFDSRTRENWFSPRLLELLGYDPGELSGSWENLLGSWKNLLHPDDSEKARAAFADHLAQDVPYDIEYRMRTKSGDYHWFQVRGKSLRDATGRAYRTSGSISDTTQRKAIETELAAAKEIAEEATQAKSDFLANMSHELRTPMNAILGYSEMLMEEAEDLEQEDFIPDLKKINQAGKHLLSLINDVLDLSKIESGKMEAFAESIDLDSLIDEVSATTQPLMGKNGNKLSIERGKNLGSAHQDLTKLRQTLFNLLSNAAKFTQEGTITLHVNRIEQAGENWLSFAVSDTGIGIAADKLEHVFMEFAQADDSTTRNYGGTGLGLAISRRFCQLLGGDLSVHSVLGEGSTFTIRIPANLPEAEPQQPSADKPAAKTDAELETLHNVRPGSAILVIDDDPAACEIIERYLIKDGYSVATANSGEQGLRLAHDIQPAAITLDVMMPDMDGWSVLRALKADPVLRTIPVIMLSMIDDRMRGYSLGAVDYLTKPVDRGLLHKTLSRYYSSDASSTVLLVEDNKETRELMTRTLESSGWVVSGAGNGQEALDIMADLQPRLILLDLMMPVMDGFDFLAALRAKPKWQHIPVIVVTAKDLTADERNRLAVNTEKVLEKNAFTREQLLERIHEAAAACSIDQPT